MANKKVKLNLDSLTKVESITKKSRSQSYDIAFSEKTGKFRTSQEAWEKLGLFKRGFDMYLHGSKVVLALVDEDDAQMYKRRYTTEEPHEPLNKGKYMTNDRMRKALDKDLGEDVNEFALIFAKEKDGVRYYVVQEWDDEEGSSLEHLGDDPEIEEEDDDDEEILDEVEEEEEEEEDEDEDEDIPELDDDLDFDDIEEEDEEEEDPFEDL